MKVTQEKLPASRIGLTVEIPAEVTKITYEKVVQALTLTTNIPGFRKGKVPRQVVLQRLGKERVRGIVLEELIQNSIKEAIKQESVQYIGNSRLESDFDDLFKSFEPGETLTFTASVDVPPTVELGNYSALSIKAEEVVFNPEDVEKAIEEKRKEKSILVPVEDRPAEMGDSVIIDYEGRFAESEELIPNASTTGFQTDLEGGRLIPGLLEGVVGMIPEEVKEIAVTFPTDYPNENLAGQPAIFKVTLQELKTRELPDLDDDFAKDVGEFETLEELRASLEKQFKEKAENQTKTNIFNALVVALVESASIDLPETLVEEEVTRLLTQTAMQMSNYGIDIRQLFNQETIPMMRDKARPEAIGELNQAFALAEVAKRESLQAEDKAIETRFQEVLGQFKDEEIDEQKLRLMITEDLTKEKVLEWLKDKATVELVPVGTLSPKEETQEEADSSEEASEE